MTTIMLDLPEALEAAGVNVRVLDGWDQPQVIRGNPYLWREDDGDAAGVMHHHVASGHYDPNRAKANGFVGLSYEGSSTLYQERYNEGDYEPVITISNAYPAPISSGAGDVSVLDRVRQGIEVTGRQGPDTPGYYGNTHYVNYEWVCKGDGSPIDPATWEMMRVVCTVQNEMYGWTPNSHIGHGHHTRRKIDLWDGAQGGTPWTGFDLTIEALREDMNMGLTTERWATRLRRPKDTDRMVDVGILTEDEREYWGNPEKTPLYVDGEFNDEFQDLRDAVEVRSAFWQ